jgi:hypothetical protein
MFSEQAEGLGKIIWDFQATQVQKNHKKSFLGFPVGTIKKNLNSNMKLFVWQWENKNKKWKYIGPTTRPLESFPYVLLIQL